MTDKPCRPDTRLVQGGRRDEWLQGMVNVPVHRGSTILFDSVAELEAAAPAFAKSYYGLHGTPTHWALAEALTQLEPGGVGTMLYPSGLAAIASAILSVLSAGDELLVSDSVYGPTRHFCDRQLKRFGVSTRYYDPLIGDEIAGMIGDKTRAIFLESPGSLTMEVQDVPGICGVARERGVVTMIDNTWATPLFFPAITAGVDMSILAVTKYVGGHADLLMGSVTANANTYQQLERISWDLGQTVSADDAALAARGLRTMGVRLRRHEESAIKIARWLGEQRQVAAVIHPALEGCPGHQYWKRDFTGSSGLFSILLKDLDDAAANRFVESLELFGIGYSWGGYESLALPIHPERIRTVRREKPAGPMIRLHIGLEDPDDLIADLAQALACQLP